ncbi:hypothetical protein M3M38_07335 [Fructilactobacillus cliffordii]|uniref:hypothetical protein n=1 Tax=Fructilactobacillus cliffordii TaxID=2940299 RepID=UPI002092B0AA|nr:hypothetical protein [Fructilactobacillus cliffordii]USS86472.1 hypothetical protein M3M38_07335 [Fructilactobacillus cliffordii]
MRTKGIWVGRWIIRILIALLFFAMSIFIGWIANLIVDRVGLIGTAAFIVISAYVLSLIFTKLLVVYESHQNSVLISKVVIDDIYRFENWDTAHEFIIEANKLCKKKHLKCITYAVPVGGNTDGIDVTIHVRDEKVSK